VQRLEPLGALVAGLSPSCCERVNATAAVNSVRAQQVVVNVRRGEVKAAQSEPKYDRQANDTQDQNAGREQTNNGTDWVGWRVRGRGE